jgi:formylglycine-generating enzyme required for sulfatase activity
MGNKPTNFVSWYDAIRFANWMHNGQGNGDTESGAYTLLGGTPTPSNGLSIVRNPGAIWFLPSEDEWYKAAYHKNDGVTGNYWDYPTASDIAPTSASPPGGPNSANHGNSALTDAGAYVDSAGPYGTFDQGGNLYEWNEALISGTFRGLRGGSWDQGSASLASSTRAGSMPSLDGDNYGFRLVTVPEPTSIALMSLGMVAIGGLMWRRRKS